LLARLNDEVELALLLDYDGTLVPIAPTPELATPPPELLALLEALCSRPRTHVHLVSGRSADALGGWLGHLPLHLWTEHGAYYRSAQDRRSVPTLEISVEWMTDIRRVLDRATARTPGSFVEPKQASLAWHYRGVNPETALQQAQALRLALIEAIGDRDLDVLDGRKVIEVRIRGVSKAIAATWVAANHPPGTAILAIGDDRTDEDLFAALPESSVTVAVGRRKSFAKYHLADDRAVRELLSDFVVK
jgi:trehalose 6-phosphate synthase/phosphatase